MWTPADRALVGDYGSGQALTDDQWRMLQPMIPPAKPGGRPSAPISFRDAPKLWNGLKGLEQVCDAPQAAREP